MEDFGIYYLDSHAIKSKYDEAQLWTTKREELQWNENVIPMFP